MSIRTRTTKLIARRHDLNYFKRMSPIRAWQWWLALAALVCAVFWFSGTTLAHGNADFSAGPISSSHAVFGQRCELCHVPVIQATRWTPSFGRRNHVPDSACLSCHTAAPHHPMESVEHPTCGSCHTEHVGAMHLAATADRGCTQCHANLETRGGVLQVAAHITGFASQHPDFRPLPNATAQEKAAVFALRFNHAEHMHPGLRTPQGALVTLQCQNCHNPELNAEHRPGFAMAPVSFDKSCRVCHSLDFDPHIQQEAPHGKPEQVQAFIVQSITEFAQQHPDRVAGEIRNWPMEPLLPGQPRMPAPRNSQEWISNRVARAETIVYREKCALCHKDLNRASEPAPQYTAALAGAGDATPRILGPNTQTPSMAPAPLPLGPIMMPRIEPTYQPTRWFTHAIFSHTAHQAVGCAECHTKALSSQSGTDVLMPSIATCRRCHDGMSSPQGPPVKTGHAESGCFLCHVYHGPQEAALKSDHALAQMVGH